MDFAPVDVVVPCLNEADNISDLVASLAAQCDDNGLPLGNNSFRIVLVDNGSHDRTPELFSEAVCRYGLSSFAVLHEPVKSHIQARITGQHFACRPEEASYFPILATADADTQFHPRWIWRVGTALASGAYDTATCSGYFSDSFWRAVPKTRELYFRYLGSYFFSETILREFGYKGQHALFTSQINSDFGRMPSDCAFAVRKETLLQVGGYRREYWNDGREILGEGWNLKCRLEASGACDTLIDDTPYQTSPRRLVLETAKMLAGGAYSNGMSDLRGAITLDHLNKIETSVDDMEFMTMQRYVLRNGILLRVILQPQLLNINAHYFLPEVYGKLLHRLKVVRGRSLHPSELHLLADELIDAWFPQLLKGVANIRLVA